MVLTENTGKHILYIHREMFAKRGSDKSPLQSHGIKLEIRDRSIPEKVPKYLKSKEDASKEPLLSEKKSQEIPKNTLNW